MLECDVEHDIAFDQYINLECDKECDVEHFLELDFCRYSIIIKRDTEEDYRKPHVTTLTQHS